MSTVTQLFILAGFLGAGKTTLLNNCLALLHGHQVGVVINEFGTVGIDRARIKQDNDVPVVELNNGQIFCSCLAGSFVESIGVLLHQQPEYILVESSGLAKPAPLMEIIKQIKRQTSAAFVYRGMIAVLDIKTYPVLSQSVYALNEQLKYSDAILLNKVDLVDETTRIKIRRELENKYPQAKI
ncbi:MAG TPA: cobalamin biosynthesis protein CobW, partial [Firmicutes bacterium]|nr:cobalamin biosynthesis protein CobW [Bacillota bacterium]